ncbi:MAG: hypothetical protein ACOYOK_02285 [Pseudobdellovibrionaceae bacterium]
MTRYGGVAAWLRGSVAAWQCGSVAVWQCGRVAVWLQSSQIDAAEQIFCFYKLTSLPIYFIFPQLQAIQGQSYEPQKI